MRKLRNKFYDDLEYTSDVSRLPKVLLKDPSFSEFSMNHDSSFTKSSNETLEILSTIHFPESEPEDFLTSSINQVLKMKPMKNLNQTTSW